MELKDWPWQARSVEAVESAWKAGHRAVCLTCATGMGKGKISFDLVRPFLEAKDNAVILSNRRMLTSQISERLDAEDLDHAFFAANYPDDYLSRLTVVSAQTAKRRKHLPPANVVVVDEAHSHAFDDLVDYYKKHTKAEICGLTATPIGLKHYDHLIVGGTKSEGREYKALVPVKVYSPSEPDISGIRRETKKVQSGEVLFSLVQHHVFADVLQHFLEIQDRHKADFPAGIPAILWAPGVPESRYFAEAFTAAGVPSAHIDGETSAEDRKRIRAGSKSGEIRLVTSMGVMREGIDWPWLAHGICVQTWGAILTYLQCVGRLMRSSANKPYAILQEHAGAWHRLGSPNRDIPWELGDTVKSIERKLKPPAPKDAQDTPEGIVCPKCHTVRKTGPTCPTCGYAHSKSVRMVMTDKGELTQVEGSPNYMPPGKGPDPAKIWNRCLWRCAASGRTLGQAVGIYRAEMKEGPPADTKFPVPAFGSVDWGRKVIDKYPWMQRKGKS